jgi:multiple sugar transport system ATP-binding protein
MAVLQLENVTKAYDHKPALRGVELKVEKGEILALLGPTGAGKTSTLLSVAGLVSPDSGRILIGGDDVTRSDPRLRDIAIVFEGFNLLPLLSVYENIAFPLRSPIYQESAAEIDTRVRKAAQDLKIAHLLDRQIDQLSGGERQRVAIARALVRSPRLYLLDEPLSALDLKLRESLRLELRELQQRHDATILYATHDYHGAAAIADRIALIDAGRIIQVGTLSELLDNPSHVSVGRLIGSPSMALFNGRITPNGVEVKGFSQSIPRAGLRLAPESGGRNVTLGVWPEDIVLSSAEKRGWHRGDIYATDFRGLDRAVQVRLGDHSFRKVVPLAVDLKQGDACWFDVPAGSAFVFDMESGARLNAGPAAGRG